MSEERDRRPTKGGWLPPNVIFGVELDLPETLRLLTVIASAGEPLNQVNVSFGEDLRDPWPKGGPPPRTTHGRLRGPLKKWADHIGAADQHTYSVGTGSPLPPGTFTIHEGLFSAGWLSTVDDADYYSLGVKMGSVAIWLSDAYNGL